MGLFDSLKRDRKAAETVKSNEEPIIIENTTYEDDIVIEDIEVVEREVVPEVEKDIPLKPIKSFKDKAPVKHGDHQPERRRREINDRDQLICCAR